MWLDVRAESEEMSKAHVANGHDSGAQGAAEPAQQRPKASREIRWSDVGKMPLSFWCGVLGALAGKPLQTSAG